ncbi:MAG TPA: alpha/beta fold hydrolase [Solirubrobacteraceae bacterium]|jgi:dienelactone hydrolase|nr:alpha/beta fold hydrolase [Solirubrobacteraceae bacterium]
MFATPLQNQFAGWAFEYVAEGADVGELEAIANDMANDSDDAYYDAWYGHAKRHRTQADEAKQRGRGHTARYHYLRAVVYASVSYKLLFGTPVDPRLKAAFNTQFSSFLRALALTDPPAEPLDIKLDGHRLSAFFMRAQGSGRHRRPTIILVNGYDASISDMYLAMGHQALARGYHVVLVDGPGQGKLLVQDGATLIAAWERVVRAVVDVVVKRDDVDRKRLVLQGWSLGGHLCLRGATGEPRIAAVVSDPPAFSLIGGQLVPSAAALGLSPEAAARLPEISDADLARLQAAIDASQQLRWVFVQRGFWVNGASDLREWLQKVSLFTLEGRANRIRCPVLGTFADRDPLAQDAKKTLSRLGAPTTLLTFTAAEGAGAHQETLNRALAETRILDWLDETLAQR